ncbi:RsmB/NOP family class I SAM-dependent RNA methyltransferase [Candidatus Woesearchaeota archaeon]|nr:RsmB/NOP family class I SAM-dependent RNA methyltransferase [Candidatus Woesearchaeota archaeon]
MSVFEKRYHELGYKPVPVVLKPSIRVNTLRCSEPELFSRLAAKGVVLEKIPFAKNGYWVEKTPFSLGASIEYLRGYLTPQEAAAQLPVQVLDPKPGERVLDMAAAPGVKTSQICQWMQNKGELVAVEKNNRRLPGLKNNLERLGVSNCIAFNTDAGKLVEWTLTFDKILLDAPCMGNYVKEKDWFGKHSQKEFVRNNATQKELISAAITMLKPGGALVYSTCSLEPEEDELIIDWAVRKFKVRCVQTGLTIGNPGLTTVFDKRLSNEVQLCRRFWPSKTQTEGFFIAKLVKA